MKNILITGAYGFVGTNLSAYLVQQEELSLWALDREKRGGADYTVFYSWEELDGIDWDAVDTVIHLAGKAHDTKNRAEAQTYFDINTGLTEKIFDRFMASKARKFIFFSSVKAAADKVQGGSLTEEIIPAPVGPYGESKIRAEEYILAKKTEDKKIYILRPCMIHGPGNKGNLNLLYNVVCKGCPWPLGIFDNHRSFTSIDNLNFVVGQLIDKDINSGIYHMGDDETVSTNELIRLIAASVNKPVQIWNVNASVIKWMAKIGDKIHLPLNTERLQKLTENYVVSNQKIKEALGIRQMPVRAADGFKKTLSKLK